MDEIKAIFYETDVTLAEIEELLSEMQQLLEQEVTAYV